MAVKKLTKKAPKKKVEKRKEKVLVEDDKRKVLKEEAKKNTTVTKKDSKDKVEETIKKGTPLDHATKKADSYVGISKGVTVNMDNYESLRVDCWLSIPLEDKTPTEKFMELSEIIQEQLEYEVTQIVNK